MPMPSWSGKWLKALGGSNIIIRRSANKVINSVRLYTMDLAHWIHFTEQIIFANWQITSILKDFARTVPPNVLEALHADSCKALLGAIQLISIFSK